MKLTLLLTSILSLLAAWPAASADPKVSAREVSVQGSVAEGNARLIIEALLNGGAAKPEPIYLTSLQQVSTVALDRIEHRISAAFHVLQGEPAETVLTIQGEGEIKEVTGEHLLDWAIRREPQGARLLNLRWKKVEPMPRQLVAAIVASQEVGSSRPGVKMLTLTSQNPGLASGYIRIHGPEEVAFAVQEATGIIPLEEQFLPEAMRAGNTNTQPPVAQPANALGFRFDGGSYSLVLRLAPSDPEARTVVLHNFRLIGKVKDNTVEFTLSALARVKNPEGGTIALLSGAVGLTEIPQGNGWHVRTTSTNPAAYIAVFEKAGEFPITARFNASISNNTGGSQAWSSLAFRVAPSTLQPFTLQGLPEGTEFEVSRAARPERVGQEFLSFLPADGTVNISWRTRDAEAERKLFFSGEMLAQVAVSPGVMRQTALFDFRVMQGEMSQLGILLSGGAEVTRVQGPGVLSWQVTPLTNSTQRRLDVRFNQPQKASFALQIQLQSPIGAFPQELEATQMKPEGITRFAGSVRVVNDGAVRLTVATASGLSQISPDQFPENDLTKALMATAASQRFAYRFSSPDFRLAIHADQILPELTISEILVYHHGENESTIDAEFEVDIREAPLRELQVAIPRGYAIAKVAAGNLSDYFLRETEGQNTAELRLVFGQPVSGRLLVQLRLERNQALGEQNWILPRVEVSRAKSVRGHIAVTADAGFRITAGRIEGMSEVATAFFPRKLPRIQSAFRLSEPAWQATLAVERLPQTLQADVFHLFSIGEGIAYGSSIITYTVSGAPVSVFRVDLSSEYANVEFTGKDVRNWSRTNNGYLVQLHTPVAGTYTLLASYERPFKAQGETLAFAGARPADAQSEQGHTIVTSAYQFQVKPVEVSSGLLPLETREVPAEYRLFFDSPILAAYRYTSRPFSLSLALSPLRQGDSLSQVVDRAALTTKISKEGQVLTDARYFLKNRGNPHLKVTLPPATELWSATINGTAVVPVADGGTSLLPLPHSGDPNAILNLELKLASRSSDPNRIRIAAPSLAAPILLARWDLQPDTGRKLSFQRGSLTPSTTQVDTSGFGALMRLFSGRNALAATLCALAAIGLSLLAVRLWKWTTQSGVYKFTSRYFVGAALATTALLFAIGATLFFGEMLSHHAGQDMRTVTLLAPVQQAGSVLSVEVANQPVETTLWTVLSWAWPVLLALALWIWAWINDISGKSLAYLLGWAILLWVTLRSPAAIAAVALPGLIICFLLVYLAIPAFRRLSHIPPAPDQPPPPSAQAGPAQAAALLAILFALASAFSANAAAPAPGSSTARRLPAGIAQPVAQSVLQEVKVENNFATGHAQIQWQAVKGQLLPILFEPGVLTRISFPTNLVKIVQTTVGGQRAQCLFALEDGPCEIDLVYQIGITRKEADTGFTLPTNYGLVNQLRLRLIGVNMDVAAPGAVSITREADPKDTVALLVLQPSSAQWIAWRPRTRDVRHEKAVFYAELSQLFVPAAGVIEGAHKVAIRPAQGELDQIVFVVPPGLTISDVAGPELPSDQSQRSIISSWRFDPDSRRLYVIFSTSQSKPFAILVRSQTAVGPLPFEQSSGVLSIEGAAGQIGQIGVATGKDVQLDAVEGKFTSPINLEDFPSDTAGALQAQIQGLTVRRAFRYANIAASISIKASPVEPDVRAEMQDTLSLSEDRTILASKIVVDITRAGIFQLSFVLPPGLAIESVSGEALSHWADMNSPTGKVVTLHLKGKTEGQQQFDLTLTGPGIKPVQGWKVPQVVLREASKQRGSLLLVPEQGLRLQVASRENLTQLDPEKAGIRQKGVLAFRVLQAPWDLTLDIEQVDAWIQVTTLQQAAVTEAAVKVTGNLQYQIENTGIKYVRVYVPTNAESVRFEGDQVSDSLPVAGSVTNGLQLWEVRLHRRMVGTWFLQVTYQTLLQRNAPDTILRGLEVEEVDLQRGYVTLQSSGRLQVRIEKPPAALQSTEWQSIPRALLRNMPETAANFAFRLVEPSFVLPLTLERHEATKLLPARVNSISLNSVVSDNATVLTHVTMQLIPGDKRLLQLALPKDALFWFAFVNQNGVWPWQEQERILLPLDQPSRQDKPMTVEVFYSVSAGKASNRSLDLRLLAPRFDLPLENISWRVSMSRKWDIKDWSGTMHYDGEQFNSSAEQVDLNAYLQKEATSKQERSRTAEEWLATGNQALEQGDPQTARRAFQAAYGLSTHDAAFNEDARVQLHNIKLQQALVGLNVRQVTGGADAPATAGKLREQQGRQQQQLRYTQQDAKDLLTSNTAADNAALTKLAERIVQQQDAALTSPTAIRANVPEQDRAVLFKRSVLIDPWADLTVELEAVSRSSAPWGMRFLIIVVASLVLAAIAGASRALRRRETTA